MTVGSWFNSLRIWLIGPSTNYNVGDSVQLKGGQHLMVIKKILSRRGMKQPLLQCEWYEPTERKTFEKFFAERDIVPFDWYASAEERLKAKLAHDSGEDRLAGKTSLA